MLLPFIKVLEKLAYLTVKDKEGEGNKDNIEEQFKLLDERFLQSPSFAVEKCRELTNRMGEIAKESIDMAMSICVDKYDKEKAEQIAANEAAVDLYEDRLGTYLVKLSSRDLSAKDSQSVSTILHVIGDFERISDHAVNLLAASEELRSKGLGFSAAAEKELKVLIGAVSEILNTAERAFSEKDLAAAAQVEPLKQVIVALKEQMRTRHILRMQQGHCSIEAGFVWSDLLTDLERTADHCSNIAGCVLDAANHGLNLHETLRAMRADDPDFRRAYGTYAEKYRLQAV